MSQENIPQENKIYTKHAADVPSPIDLRSPEDAKHWAQEANIKRPWRTEIFKGYADLVLTCSPLGRVLELGSGPGHLAQILLQYCPGIHYTAYDFSQAMHELSKSKLLTKDIKRCQFICGDFKQQDWQIQLAGQSAHQQFDVIIIHQALHELRHKMHAPDFHRAVKTLMHKNSIYIVCDHICAPHAMQNDQLYMNIAEHIESLREAVLSNIEWQRELNGLAIFRAGNIES